MTIGRNDPCPCGSGRKYKRCCGVGHAGGPKLTLMAADDAGGAAPDRRWEADVVPLSIRLEDDPGARTAVVLIVNDDRILYQDLLSQAPAEPDRVAQVLCAALLQVAADRGQLPAAVWVRHEEVGSALADLPELGSVRIAAAQSLAMLDPVAVSLARHMTGEAQSHRIGRPETWRGWGFSNAAIAALFEAAAGFYDAAPWRSLTNEQLLFAELPDGREWTACTLGNGGKEFGIALYEDPDDFFRQIEAATHADAIDSFRGEIVSLVFCNGGGLPRRMLKEVSAKNWKVAGPDAYPVIFPVNTPGGGLTRRHLQDLGTLLRAIPRFVERYRELLMSRVFPPGSFMEWRDRDSGTSLRYEGSVIEPDMPLWPPPFKLDPALPTGRAANPEAGLEPFDVVEASKEHHGILDRFRTALETGGLGAATVKRHTRNVADFLHCLRDYHGIPLNAFTEYDLRTVLYDLYIRKLHVPVTYVRAMQGSLQRFFRFTGESEGLEFPWAESVLKERDQFEERWATFPGGFWWEPAVQAWRCDLNNDLDARGLLSDSDMANGEQWGATMGTVEWKLSHELQRRWLLWREELVKGGVVEPADVRAALVRRQRQWETTPHSAHGGATPIEAILRERDKTNR